ncbi:hypothetical protein SAMN04488128_104254 [Chitinophaga eiseniae]|uniref:Uncharacterized protein n=1 Tax=Chitinophaga eiseniae TaxID=634771 RepID=A0A1T4T9W5_9BACT|nr:hypothetical protein SAMN04488128_104254 [Chitinophaga eiseniae]
MVDINYTGTGDNKKGEGNKKSSVKKGRNPFLHCFQRYFNCLVRQ